MSQEQSSKVQLSAVSVSVRAHVVMILTSLTSYHKYQYHIYNSWLTKGERERERERANVASSLLTRSARDFLIGYSRTISSSYRPLINSWPTKGGVSAVYILLTRSRDLSSHVTT